MVRANLAAKEEMVTEIKEKLTRSASTVLSDYRGLNVAEMNELRTRCREAGVEFRVLKNTLVRIATQQLGQKDMEPYLEGPSAFAFGQEDPVAPAKLLQDFIRTHKAMSIKAGYLQGRVLSADEVKTLASLPSREELLARVIGGMQSPLYGLVGSLNGLLRNFARVLDEVRKTKEATS